jgi:hypothetical protein
MTEIRPGPAKEGQREGVVEALPPDGAKNAPWFMIPPGHKGREDVRVAKRMAHALERMHPGGPLTLGDI